MYGSLRRALLATIVLAVTITALPAQTECLPSIPMQDFEYRFGIVDELESDGDYLQLVENPTVIELGVEQAEPGDEASTVATTELHAIYPTSAAALVEVLKDDAILAEIVPDLAVHMTLCRMDGDSIKQMQRTEFNMLFLTFGTEYLIDVHYAIDRPDEFGSYWGMYDSLDGRLAYQYGSWYFADIEVGGRGYSYVRHFTKNGIVTRLPGLRMAIRRSADERVRETLNAIYREAVRRHGETPRAAVR